MASGSTGSLKNQENYDPNNETEGNDGVGEKKIKGGRNSSKNSRAKMIRESNIMPAPLTGNQSGQNNSKS